MRRRSCRCVLLIFAFLLTGCGGGDPIHRWQLEVRDYINDEHNGDINGIRHYSQPMAQRQFGIIGGSSGGVGLLAPSRADTTSVLLGRTQLGEHDWHVFLVGVIKYTGSFDWLPLDDPTVTDIRLAAFHLDAHDRFIWRITEPDESQLQTYIAPQQAKWDERYADRPPPGTAPHIVFPWEGDEFDYEVNVGAQTITAHERTSGAAWTLHLVPEDEREKLATK